MEPRAVLTTIPSDSHSWNLVYMEKLLEEQGYEVINLGVCTPFDLVAAACREDDPVLVVVSTINGLAHQEGAELARRLAALDHRSCRKLIIGGNLAVRADHVTSVSLTLYEAGFDHVFAGPNAIPEFLELLAAKPRPERRTGGHSTSVSALRVRNTTYRPMLEET